MRKVHDKVVFARGLLLQKALRAHQLDLGIAQGNGYLVRQAAVGSIAEHELPDRIAYAAALGIHAKPRNEGNGNDKNRKGCK